MRPSRLSSLAACARAERDARLRGLFGAAAAYADQADLLLTEDAGRGLAQGCAEDGGYLPGNSDADLGPLDHGYANRTYRADDICPVP